MALTSIVEVEINAPLEAVASLFADPRNSPRWMVDLERYEPVSGSTYRLVPKTGSMVFLATVVARDLPHELRLRLDMKNIEVGITGRLTTLSPTMTRLRSEEVFTFRGLRAVLGAFAGKPIRAAHRRHIEDFKTFAETELNQQQAR